MKLVHVVILTLGGVSMTCHQLYPQVPPSSQPWVAAAGSLAASLAATLGVLAPSATEKVPAAALEAPAPKVTP